ncbi:sugar ABC transporter permease [Microbacterium aoyamense]|uniref:Sugar ABC transporter permease n=1 Tax=Microbacterium aoyamense TaxID=344166 RepID=A0ABN2PJ06_9MICO|nr:sugar ABC transporter permease [Microbacterium aoyamense]
MTTTATAETATPSISEQKARHRPSIPRFFRSEGWTGLLFLTPFAILLIVFQYLAFALMVRNSLFDYSLLNPANEEFIGLGNFVRLLGDSRAHQSILVTLLFAAGLVILQIPCGLALAMLLNRKRRGVSLIRAVVFLPVVVSMVVVSTMWLFIYSPENGLANSFLEAIGIPAQPFITSASQALPSLIFMSLWQQVGFSMILFLAGLQSIPTELEEAAVMDGANAWQRFWHIILPLLNRTLVMVVVVSTTFALQAFAQAQVMTSGGPEGSTNFLLYNIYTFGFTHQQPGYASAMSIVLIVIVLIVSAVQMRALRNRLED